MKDGGQTRPDLSEYDDPVLYEAENSADEDLDFIQRLVEQTGGPVLDIACGSGRIGLPLARRGFEVTGIDLSLPMLDHGRGQASGLPIVFMEADCRRFDLGRRFALVIMTGHAFQNLEGEADQRALFENVSRHLEPGGVFTFETRNPAHSPLMQSCARRPFRRYRLPDGAEVSCDIQLDYDSKSQLLDYRIWRHNSVTGQESLGSGRLRFSTDPQIRQLLADAGLAVQACYGNWDESRGGGDQPELIYICKS